MGAFVLRNLDRERTLDFHKYEGLGNDFVVVDAGGTPDEVARNIRAQLPDRLAATSSAAPPPPGRGAGVPKAARTLRKA